MPAKIRLSLNNVRGMGQDCHKNFVTSSNIYFVYKFMCNFIHYKPRSAYPKNSRKSMITVPPTE